MPVLEDNQAEDSTLMMRALLLLLELNGAKDSDIARYLKDRIKENGERLYKIERERECYLRDD
jgi:hypothetical protein